MQLPSGRAFIKVDESPKSVRDIKDSSPVQYLVVPFILLLVASYVISAAILNLLGVQHANKVATVPALGFFCLTILLILRAKYDTPSWGKD